MAHHIHGIFASPQTLASVVQQLPGAIVVPMSGGVAWVPVFDELLDAVSSRADIPGTVEEGFVHFGGVLPGVLAAASAKAPVAYVETDYFGGSGSQIATVYEGGVRTKERCTVNQALAVLGVQTVDDRDEWDVIGLANYRGTPPAARAAFAAR